MRIDVTFNDIMHGSVGNPSGCAVARAIKRHYGLDSVMVTHKHAYLSYNVNGEFIRMIAPFAESVQNKIVRFDRYGFILPFSFDFEPEAEPLHLPRERSAAVAA